ncbi:MAG TPA: hypothetical protein VMA13_09850 [Candidatus Saccharimonadales bacterium]|nr:hypothetical protein [Candidatus Saccharimonadales bacterium]
MQRLLSSTRHSGTPESPTPGDLIRNMVTELSSRHPQSWVTFETKRAKHFAEVAEEPDSLVVYVAYPFSEDYPTLFARHGLVIPDGWQIKKFRKKRWCIGGGMILKTRPGDRERVINFLERLFPALYGVGSDYKLSGYFQ